MTKDELPKLKDLARKSYLAIPLAVIVWLLVTGYTPMKAALFAILISVGIAWVVAAANRLRGRPAAFTWRDAVGGLEAGGRGALGVIAATACAGIIIGVVTLTGLGLKLGSSLVSLANGQLFLTLVFTMFTSLILGMGVPTTANYVITSTIAAPAIIIILRQVRPELGEYAPMIVLPAHMFAFYFGIIADVTPPVALAAFAGAGIAKANPMRTGFNATKLAIAAFLVPYIFVYNPQMLLFDVTPLETVWMILTSCAGIIAVSAAVMGFLRRPMALWERPAWLAGGLLLVTPGIVTDGIGAGVIALMYLVQRFLPGPAKAAA